ncbi:MAG: glycosyl hydrolase [Bacteroidota bacterium]
MNDYLLRGHTSLRLLVILTLLLPLALMGQRKNKKKSPEPVVKVMPSETFEGLHWRNIGPFRGGRSCAVTGVSGKPNLFYFGSAGGGIWKTKNGGGAWENISDGYFGGSIGAIAVSEDDPNIIFVGGGEKTVRGNVSYGYGVWKTIDGGKTWESMGLKDSRHIGRIRIHPRNSDLVYAAVMGDLYKSSETRGIYRSKDGGQNWERVLFANADAGAVDLVIDPNNPRVIYASTWRIRRTPYSLSSGGDGSALWRSLDGGDTWENLSEKKGMPKGPLGIIGVTVSPVNSDRIFALVEANDGGVFRSDDGGETWRRTNQSRALRQRAWYYTRIYADTKDEDVVYVMNVSYQKSTDGGKTFKSYRAPHGDHHDLWIAPEDPQRMIIGDDGGAQVTYDGGENWSTYQNQPTAQFYRVVTDNHFPYRIYAAQQDNSTVRIAHRTDGRAITSRDWESTAGGESAHIAIDPQDNDIVYGGSYGGFLTRQNHKTNETQAINVWPDNPMGHGVENMRYRFQWNFPIFFSPHDANKLYTCSNFLHVSTDQGRSWKVISPDLTRNDSAKLGSSGGPITKDNTGVEYYCTIFAAAESPHEPEVIWTGSDDGLVHITQDGGANWENVTPPMMPEWCMVNSVEIDPHNKAGVYIAATSYKMGDYHPYLYKSNDYGKTWTQITNGIDKGHFTRVLRADPVRKGLLYAGTETGMYISFDDGNNWQPFQQNLPIVPITDLTIKDNNLIAATQGRSLWIIDDLTVLHQLTDDIASRDHHLFAPMPSYRMGGVNTRVPKNQGQNHPGGVMVYTYLNEVPADSVPVHMVFLEANGTEIKRFKRGQKKAPKALKELTTGLNRFVWDMRYEDAKKFEGMILWWGQTTGPKAIPGNYKVRLVIGTDSMEQDFQIVSDQRSSASVEDLKAQFDLQRDILSKLSETHEAIIDMRKAKSQLMDVADRWKKDEAAKEVVKEAKRIHEEISKVEEALYQTKNRSRQDPLNYPIRLNNKLAHLGSLVSVGDNRPTQQSYEFYEEVTKDIDQELAKWSQLSQQDVAKLNQMIKSQALDLIQVPSKESAN